MTVQDIGLVGTTRNSHLGEGKHAVTPAVPSSGAAAVLVLVLVQKSHLHLGALTLFIVMERIQGGKTTGHSPNLSSAALPTASKTSGLLIYSRVLLPPCCRGDSLPFSTAIPVVPLGKTDTCWFRI